MFRESMMCLQTVHYATTGEITGTIEHVKVILSIQVATVFVLERWYKLVWRASQYYQNML